MADENFAERKTVVAPPAAPDLEKADGILAPPGAETVVIPPLAPGSVLFGTYEIVERLGAGGMGDVYRAQHLRFPEFRAIKVMNPSLVANKDAVAHFHREARTLLEVAHPAIVRCHDLLQDEFGRFFLIMELVEGISLSERMNNSWLSPSEVRVLGARLASGLAAVHAHEVIHRDIAPDNIMLPEGQLESAKLIDFGIAKWLQPGEESVFGWKGKLRYASPEQFGFFDGVIDYRSDYYSLGLMLCAAAHSDLGDLGSNFPSAIEARQGLTERFSRIPSAIRSEITPLLAFDPNDRPDSIESTFGQSPPVATPAIRKPRRPVLTRRLVSSLTLFGATALAGLVAFLVMGQMDEVEVPAQEPVPLPQVAAPNPFMSLRSQLELASGRPGGTSTLAINPNPAVDGDPYWIAVTPDCDCYAMVFLLDAEGKRVDLLYPNEFDPPRRLLANRIFEIPSNDSYRFEAVAGVGVDHLKLVLLSDLSTLSPDGTSWGFAEGETERQEEFATFLDMLAEKRPSEWASAETRLRIAQ
jgi:hypothetical protein